MRTAGRLLPGGCAFLLAAATIFGEQSADRVRPIAPPDPGLPTEEASAGERRFSFIAYGDTRGQADGSALQTEHALVVDKILAILPEQRSAGFPVRFVIQSGDAVASGRTTPQWNTSFTPIIERLTRGAGLPYLFAVGNHDVGGQPVGGTERQLGYRNVADAMANLWPAEDSPRRLKGYPTFAFGYGQFFFIALDSDIPTDQIQLAWVTKQLEDLDRARYPYVVAYFHHPPITSGGHGGSTVVEVNSEEMRKLYMPLFRKHHVRMIVAGHDHLFDHYIERWEDAKGKHRLDQVVSGGGGAPIYTYRGEPDFARYAQTAMPDRVTIEHLARPGRQVTDNPHHFMVIDVDGPRLWIRAVGTAATPFLPYGQPRIELADAQVTATSGGR